MYLGHGAATATAAGRAGPRPQAPQAPPLRVFIQAGLKTHAEGQHDYPQFLADWSKLLTNRGAIVDGALHFPSARELAAADVLVIYKGDAGYLSMEDRATLDNFLRRGGGHGQPARRAVRPRIPSSSRRLSAAPRSTAR